MAKKSGQDEPCPVARGAGIIADRWALLIVRDAFDGVTRFGDFQRGLGMARNILADRLRMLVEEGILASRPASDGSSYQEYVLTAKGEDLFPVIVALRRWGERHLFAPGEAHSVLAWRESGEAVEELALRTADGKEPAAGETFVRKVTPGGT